MVIGWINLDSNRFCISDKVHWIHEVIQLEHVQNQTLSDHDPIVLTLQITASPSSTSVRKTTYFKANPELLKKEGTIPLLQEAWEDHPNLDNNPTQKFALA